MKTITRDEAYKIFEKYDKQAFQYYKNNAHCFGFNAINYALRLLKENTCIKCENPIENKYFDGVNGRICVKCINDMGIYYTLEKDGFIKNREKTQ